jgi:hypothetical protein
MSDDHFKEIVDYCTEKIKEEVGPGHEQNGMTPEQHKERHGYLHGVLEEICSDYFRYHPLMCQRCGLDAWEVMMLTEWLEKMETAVARMDTDEDQKKYRAFSLAIEELYNDYLAHHPEKQDCDCWVQLPIVQFRAWAAKMAENPSNNEVSQCAKTDQHKNKHKELNAALHVLLTDYVRRNPNQIHLPSISVPSLLIWSDKQASNPDHEEKQA